MRVKDVFMALIVVESTLIVWEDLGLSPKYVNYVWLFCY